MSNRLQLNSLKSQWMGLNFPNPGFLDGYVFLGFETGLFLNMFSDFELKNLRIHPKFRSRGIFIRKPSISIWTEILPKIYIKKFLEMIWTLQLLIRNNISLIRRNKLVFSMMTEVGATVSSSTPDQQNVILVVPHLYMIWSLLSLHTWPQFIIISRGDHSFSKGFLA